MGDTRSLVDLAYSNLKEEVRAGIMAQFQAAGIRSVGDLKKIEEPEDVRKLVGRPFPSFITKPLLDRGLLKSYKGDCYIRDGMGYVKDIAEQQLALTSHVITSILQGLKSGLNDEELVAAARRLILKFQEEEESCPLDAIYEAYRELLDVIVSRLESRRSFDEVVEMRPRNSYSTLDVYFRLNYRGALWGWACLRLMNYMDEVFAEDEGRSFALGAAITRDSVWILKFTPESFKLWMRGYPPWPSFCALPALVWACCVIMLIIAEVGPGFIQYIAHHQLLLDRDRGRAGSLPDSGSVGLRSGFFSAGPDHSRANSKP